MSKYYSSIITVLIIAAVLFFIYRLAIRDEKQYIINRLLREQGLADTKENRDKFLDKSVDELRALIKK